MQKIDLLYPVEHSGSVIRALMVRTPTAEDFALVVPNWRPDQGYPADLGSAVFAIVAHLVGLPEELVKELDWADISQIADVIRGDMFRNVT